MRILFPVLVLTSPAMAHPVSLPHSHGTDWGVPVALALIGLAAFVAQRRAARARK
jgi:hypothetical protein